MLISEDKDALYLGQPLYVQKLLERFNFTHMNPIGTPLAMKTGEANKEENEDADLKLYREAIGGLLYLSNNTRPDITVAVDKAARSMSNPKKQNWTSIKRIFKYLQGTKQIGLKFPKDKSFKIIGYSDANWGGEEDNRRSTSGIMVFIAGCLVSWKAVQQKSVAVSTMEAEYMALFVAVQWIDWVIKLLKEMTEQELVGTEYTSDIEFRNSAQPFLTKESNFTKQIKEAVDDVTGLNSEFSTTGGTSDARFFKDYCEVAEFGLVGSSAHQVDEHVAVKDIENLSKIYEEIIKKYFS